MQNLRPFVAKKNYRGWRSSGNRQSRSFSSSSPRDLPKNELSPKTEAALKVGLYVAAEKGKQLARYSEINYFKPNKHQVVFYDDDSRHLLTDFTDHASSTMVVPLAGSSYMNIQKGQRARCMREALDRGAELKDLAAATGKKVAILVDLNVFKPIQAQAVYYDDLPAFSGFPGISFDFPPLPSFGFRFRN
ncbi:uncharacterized protein LOC9320399 isoform X4 [Arabidopsis lyrata subsp. lyrata]|uniref:uncharacterized protein LOC9320399 isoform X4 n=1 Tax=Arabidopsis lyrata subsp. lyrata TaxID=81972 RepID=UPI000A29AA43|nr:uncharacterized protein LOC9320399 isoform X4 [Arabidopsis lyrata subsp. lyrata]|eukprot:XP_002884333.2 uncharacterized protein LOC9320399 isoform X4 [Arabidopsis lyrata subsp. lyrata]